MLTRRHFFSLPHQPHPSKKTWGGAEGCNIAMCKCCNVAMLQYCNVCTLLYCSLRPPPPVCLWWCCSLACFFVYFWERPIMVFFGFRISFRLQIWILRQILPTCSNYEVYMSASEPKKSRRLWSKDIYAFMGLLYDQSLKTCHRRKQNDFGVDSALCDS